MTAAPVTEVLELPVVAAWLQARGEHVVEPLGAALITGGRSNLTFFLNDAAGRRWVLRRPPLGTILATAHDVVREATVLSALAGTPVPVPALLGVGSDSQGVSFYVMHEVAGFVVRDAASAGAVPAHSARGRCATALAEGLAALHAVDPERVGLGRLGRGTDYLTRQIDLWQRQAEHHRHAAFPQADDVRAQLLAALPAQAETVLVHGDYRLDNALVSPAGELQAVLDWELCTRGDPLADLGVFLYYWTEEDDPVRPFLDPATLLPGFPGRTALLEHYVRASGRPVSRLDYYLAYAAWRLALVFEGVAARSAAGAYGDPDPVEEGRLAEVVQGLVGHAASLLERDAR
jgi:aminoglycoside phosphotransferase (APT) family kinase protein